MGVAYGCGVGWFIYVRKPISESEIERQAGPRADSWPQVPVSLLDHVQLRSMRGSVKRDSAPSARSCPVSLVVRRIGERAAPTLTDLQLVRPGQEDRGPA